MNPVRLIPLGVGEAFTARHYTSCLALGVGDDWMLIDCSHPVRKMLREGSTAAGIPLDLDRIHAVAVSHLHADHCCGLEDFGFYSYFVLGHRARLLMHPEVSARVWDGLLAAGMELMQEQPGTTPVRRQLSDYFDLIDLDFSLRRSPAVPSPSNAAGPSTACRRPPSRSTPAAAPSASAPIPHSTPP